MAKTKRRMPGAARVSAKAQLSAALERHQLGDLAAAAAAYAAILERNPRHADALNLYAVLNLQSGELLRALELSDAAIKSDRKQPGFHNNRGEILRALGQPGEALQAYESALRLDRKFADACVNAVFAAVAIGAMDKALRLSEKALLLAPHALEAHMARAEVRQAIGDGEGAQAACATALRLAPDNVDVMARLSLFKATNSDLEGAERLLERALDLAPSSVEVRLALAQTRVIAQDFNGAQHWLRQCLQLQANEPRAARHLGELLVREHAFSQAAPLLEVAYANASGDVALGESWAWALSQSGRSDAAQGLLRNMLELAPQASTHSLLGQILAAEAQAAQALEQFQAATAADPADAQYLVWASDMLSILGHFDAAIEQLKCAIRLDPKYAQAFEALAYVGGAAAFDHALSEQLRELTADESLAAEQRASAYFAQAIVSGGEFADYRHANDLMRRVYPFDREAYRRHIDTLVTAIASRHALGEIACERAGTITPAGPAPVFIIGMPRSGTTLVEQILAAHDEVYGAGEVEFFGHLSFESEHLNPELGFTLPDATIAVLRERYLEPIEPRCAGARVFTDKMPSNFLYLGLIAEMFPEARFVHCTRAPMDNCLSVYTQNFTASKHHSYSFDLVDIGHYFNDYARLMKSWELLYGDRVMAVAYEDMVANTEATSRALFEFVGLFWDAKVLEFHASSRVVSTASMVQVRQPIYTSALGRSQRYASELAPLRAALEGQT
jgi:tetratricopeptide (TPR) repeat protein